jgi:hypothetical protein
MKAAAVILLVLVCGLILVGFAAATDFTEHDIELDANYTLTLYIRDEATGSLIVGNTGLEYTGTVNGTANTTTGFITIPSGYGLLTVTVSTEGYYSAMETYLIDSDKTETIYLNHITTYPTETRFVTTHIVRFMCKDWRGQPIKGMNVTAIGVESSLGSLDWIPYFFGVNLGNTPILNTTMRGTTGYDGSIAFVMLPTEKYSIHYVYAPFSIDETRYYYPAETQYEEIFWTTEQTYSFDHISYELYNATNGSYMNLGVRYTDNATVTNNFTFWVQNSSEYVIYTKYATPPLGSVNMSYPIPLSANTIYYWGFSANSTRDENRINASNWFRIENVPGGYRIDLQIGYDDAAAEVYNWIAIIIICIFAFMFSRVTIKAGLVIVPILALFFKFIGWLATSWTILSFAITLGVFWYMRYAEEESGL